MTTQQFRPPTQQPPTRSHAPIIERHIGVPIENTGMRVLRAFTYCVCSLAAIVFLLVVLWTHQKIQAMEQTLDQLFNGPAAEAPRWPGQFGN